MAFLRSALITACLLFLGNVSVQAHDSPIPVGADTSFGAIPATSLATGPTDFTAKNVKGSRRPLHVDARYRYRPWNESRAGIRTGERRTLALPVPPPQVTTEPPSSVTDTSATLTGTVNPGELETRVYVALVQVATENVTIAPIDTLRSNLSTDQTVSLRVDTLQPSTEYYYEIAAANDADSLSGDLVTFTTDNALPVATDDSVTTKEDQSVTIEVLANDYDVDGELDSSSVTVSQPPEFGTTSVNDATGAITYVPAPDANGTDRFAYTVADERENDEDITSDSLEGTSAEATVFVNVEAVNDPPTARLDTLPVRKGGSVSALVVANDTDIEGPLDTSSVEITRPPSAGTATPEGDGVISYTHDGSATLSDQFAYRIADPEGRYDTTTVQVNVREVALTAEQDTIDLGVQQVGHPGGTASVTVTNTGEVPFSSLDAVLRDGPSGSADDFAVVEGPSDDSLDLDEERTFTVSFQPTAEGTRRAELAFTAPEGPAPDSAVATVGLVGTGVGISVDAESPDQSTPAPVTVTLRGGFVPNREATLFARRGGASSYQSLPLQREETAPDDPVQLTGTIPSALVTPAGVDYYVVLSDGSNTLTVPGQGASKNPHHLPVTVEQLSAQGPFPPETYRMISVPVQPQGKSVKDILRSNYGAYDQNYWRLSRWNPSSETYREYPEIDTLRPGDGAWLVTRAGSTLAVSEGRTVEASAPYRIPLDAGWNQVGVPFGFSVPWDTIQAATGIGPANLSGPVAYGDTSTGASLDPAYQYEREALHPWNGYFVYNGTGSRDTLVVPPVGHEEDPAVSTRLASRTSPAAEDGGYTLQVTATAEGGTLRDEQTWIGVHPDAKAGRDQYDIVKAPPVHSSFVQVSAQAGAERRIPYAASYHPPSSSGQTWTLTVRARTDSDGPHPVRLQLEERGSVPEDVQQYVLDLDRKRMIPREGQQFSIEVEDGTPRRLRVIVGTESYAETKSEGIPLQSVETELRGNAPNPFSGETQVKYQLSRRQPVTLTVYNVLGQRVRTLVQETQLAGAHKVTWKGTNQHGTPVGSGVYFVRMKAEDTTMSRKMVLVR